jgi:hypothetical protein
LGFGIAPVDNSSVPALADYVTQDVVLTTNRDWLRAELIVTPDQPGDIYQHPYGGAASPKPAFSQLFPALEFDTYVSNGVPGEPVSTLFVPCQSYDRVVFDEDALAIFWFTTDRDDTGELALARVTLANDASGTWQFIATASLPGGSFRRPRVLASGDIVNGVLTSDLVDIYLGADETDDEVADPVVDDAADEATDPVADDAADEAADPVVDDPADEATDPVVDDPADEAADPVVDDAADEATDPVIDDAADEATDPVIDDAADEATDPVVDDAADEATDPVVDDAADEATDPVVDETADDVADEDDWVIDDSIPIYVGDVIPIYIPDIPLDFVTLPGLENPSTVHWDTIHTYDTALACVTPANNASVDIVNGELTSGPSGGGDVAEKDTQPQTIVVAPPDHELMPEGYSYNATTPGAKRMPWVLSGDGLIRQRVDVDLEILLGNWEQALTKDREAPAVFPGMSQIRTDDESADLPNYDLLADLDPVVTLSGVMNDALTESLEPDVLLPIRI